MKSLIVFFLPAIFAVANGEFVPRIINGTVAKPGEFPYQVSLQQMNTSFHFCGGSILNKNYVITAAHCLVSKTPKTIKIVAGTVDLKRPMLRKFAEKFYIHEKYNASDSWVNDIALIKVITPFDKSSLISPVPMPSSADIAKANDRAIVSGFGRLAFEGDRTDLLHWVDITVAKQDYCRNIYNPSKNIYSTHLCAYDPTAVRGHCKGDSGGPLMVNGKLAGLVSWSRNCASTVYPSVYTRITSYLNWIAKHAV